MVYSAEARERQQGDAWNQIEGRAMWAVQSAISTKSSAVGSIIDAGISKEENFSLARDHGVAGGNMMQAFAHAHDLQGRTNRVREMLRHARNQ